MCEGRRVYLGRYLGVPIYEMEAIVEDTILTNTPRPGDTIEQTAARNRMPLLEERQKTHGDFGTNALISQQLKEIIHGSGLRTKPSTGTGYFNFHVSHREALDMIALKLSRILSGQASHKDHWDDIAGYAKLASEACNADRSSDPGRQ